MELLSIQTRQSLKIKWEETNMEILKGEKCTKKYILDKFSLISCLIRILFFNLFRFFQHVKKQEFWRIYLCKLLLKKFGKRQNIKWYFMIIFLS